MSFIIKNIKIKGILMLEYGYYNMDCMPGMREFPDKYFHLAIVDPPYGIKRHNVIASGTVNKVIQKNGKTSFVPRQKTRNKNWDESPPPKSYFDELKRVSKNQIIWGGNHFITKIKKDSPCWLVWNKRNGKSIQSDCELAWTSFKATIRMFEYRWQGMIQEEQNKRLVEKIIHPTQKPIALYRWLLQHYAKPGDRLISTHVGSASDLIAFEMEGYTEYIGFEIDADYYQDSVKRLEQWRKNRHPELFRMSIN